ncbi:MAG TPA: PIN domain-containing protein [Thermoplasmata archaeon]|nr:PIN domain-containing protein [Thermoplasmata archaeon]
MLDTNVFVAAVKHPRRETATLRLVLEFLRREDLALVGNDLWLEEKLRYAEEFRSETASRIVSTLVEKTRFVRVEANFRSLCRPYVTTPDPADILHAATCLQERAILVSNDRHFDRIRDEKIIEVWDIAKALRSLGLAAEARARD